MRSGNPALNDDTFGYGGGSDDNRMTLIGTVFKTLILLATLLVTFTWVWDKSTEGYAEAFSQREQVIKNENLVNEETGEPLPTQISIPANVYWYAVGGSVGAFLLAMIIIFNCQTAPYLSIPYAAAEGLVLGAVSAGFEARYPGIVMQASLITFGTLFGLLGVYCTGLIKPSQNFYLGMLAAMIGIIIVYFADIIMQMVGVGYVGVVHESGWAGIAFSGFVVVIAALNLVLDFDFIEDGVDRGAPKYMEWYGAFGLMVTLVWLYLEILRLLAKARSNN